MCDDHRSLKTEVLSCFPYKAFQGYVSWTLSINADADDLIDYSSSNVSVPIKYVSKLIWREAQIFL